MADVPYFCPVDLANLRQSGSRSSTVSFWLAAASALAVALVPRLVALAGSDFPLNDGGIFAVMIRDILENGFRLPSTTAYNASGIPFAYPPLALYVSAAVAKLTGAAIPSLLRSLPLLANLGTVVAFCALARSFARTRASALTASLLFPTLPYSIEWLITGGGLTRSFGMFFVTLAALAAHRFLITRRTFLLVPTTLFAALAVLSHPEAGASLAVTLAVFWLILGHDREAIAAGGVTAISVAALTAPWWLTVILRHGIEPMVSAGGTAGWSWARVLSLSAFSISGETSFTPIAFLALLGLVFDLTSRRPLPAVWFVVTCLFPRPGAREVILPMALLAGEAFGEVIVPALRQAYSGRAPRSGETGEALAELNKPEPRKRFPDLAPTVLVVFLVSYGMLTNAFRLAPSGQPIPALTPGERTAMAWVAVNTPDTSRFAVITSSASWAEDPTTEWFPALTGRVSIVTPQGREWLPGHALDRSHEIYVALKRCAAADAACHERWTRDHQMWWTHVFISTAIRGEYVPQPLVASIAASPDYVLVYRGPGAFIFARRGGPRSHSSER